MAEFELDEVVSSLRAAGCVFAEEEAEILVESASSPAELSEMLRRRVSGEPLEHVVGWVLFCGRRIAVDAGVFVPRRRTEFLVDCAVATAPSVVLDLCCGSGAVGLSVASARADPIEVHAVDIDTAAVACASGNLAAVGGVVHRGDLYDALPSSLRGRFDAIVVNAPYVPTSAIETMPREARAYEPRIALDGGSDGVDVHRRIARGASQWLAPGGTLLVETTALQRDWTIDAMSDAHLTGQVLVSDAGDVVVRAQVGGGT